MNPVKESELIAERIKPLFKNMCGDQYRIEVINDKYDGQYNIFFIRMHKNKRTKSVPIHSISEYNLKYLERVLDELSKFYKFNRVYRGFIGELWPSSGRLIQTKKTAHEN